MRNLALVGAALGVAVLGGCRAQSPVGSFFDVDRYGPDGELIARTRLSLTNDHTAKGVKLNWTEGATVVSLEADAISGDATAALTAWWAGLTEAEKAAQPVLVQLLMSAFGG